MGSESPPLESREAVMAPSEVWGVFDVSVVLRALELVELPGERECGLRRREPGTQPTGSLMYRNCLKKESQGGKEDQGLRECWSGCAVLSFNCIVFQGYEHSKFPFWTINSGKVRSPSVSSPSSTQH